MFILEPVEYMGEVIGPRPENLKNIIGATRQHYEKRATTVVGNTTTRRQAAYLNEIDRAITAITQRFGVGPQEIILYTYPRGNPNLTPVPVASPGLIPRQQRRSKQLETHNNSTTAVQEHPQNLTITLEELQHMSGEERARKIKALRRAASLSRVSLATISHIPASTVIKLERNMQGYEPSEKVLEGVAKGLTAALERAKNTDEQLLEIMPSLTTQEIVYRLLKARKISYPELAHRLGKSGSWVDKTIGQKTRGLNRRHIKDICDELGLEEDNPIRLHLLEKIDIEDDNRRLAGRERLSDTTILFQS